MTIGDYVHGKNYMYARYGINRPTAGVRPLKQSDIMQSFKRQEDYAIRQTKAKKIMSQAQLNQLSDFLNGLMYPKENVSDLVTEDAREQIREAMESQIDQVYNGEYGLNQYLQLYGAADVSSYLDSLLTKGTEEYTLAKRALTQKTGGKTGQVGVSTLNNRIKGLEAILSNESAARGVFNDATINKMNEVVNELTVWVKKAEKENIKSYNTKSYPELKNTLDKLNYQLGIRGTPTYDKIGEIFEVFLTLAAAVMRNTAYHSINEVVDELVKAKTTGGKTSAKYAKASGWVGGLTSEVTIDTSNFTMGEVMKDVLVNEGQRVEDTNVIFSAAGGGTQGKVDVEFSLPRAHDKLKMSAKNYKISDRSKLIHLVDGTRLSYLIQDQKMDAINHWLNIMSKGIERDGSIGTKDPKEGVDNTTLQAAKNMIYLTVAAKALAGNNLGRLDNADQFVVNNRTAKRIQIISIQNLLNTIRDNITQQMSIPALNSNVLFTNDWVGNLNEPSSDSALSRIGNLTKELASIKVTAYIKASFLNNF